MLKSIDQNDKKKTLKNIEKTFFVCFWIFFHICLTPKIYKKTFSESGYKTGKRPSRRTTKCPHFRGDRKIIFNLFFPTSEIVLFLFFWIEKSKLKIVTPFRRIWVFRLFFNFSLFFTLFLFSLFFTFFDFVSVLSFSFFYLFFCHYFVVFVFLHFLILCFIFSFLFFPSFHFNFCDILFYYYFTIFSFPKCFYFFELKWNCNTYYFYFFSVFIFSFSSFFVFIFSSDHFSFFYVFPFYWIHFFINFLFSILWRFNISSLYLLLNFDPKK